jgi:glycosyltransferase involved in cell wall biosynthesis
LKWPVVIAGDTRHPDGGTIALSRVQLLGALSERQVSQWMSRAAIYALPAHYEPFGLSALEAALSGCALVLGRTGSLQEIWEDAAVYVNPDDETDLIRAINGLISNPDRRRELAERARRRAAEFTPKRMADGYMEVYEAAAQRFEMRRVPALVVEGASCV